MQLFYAPEITLPAYTLSEEESKHCIRVLRLEKGDSLHLTDGRGNLYHATITDDHPKRCTVTIHHTESPFEPLPYHLTMAVAPTKNNDRYEWFAEKACEIGLDEISPVIGEHSERKVFKTARIEKILVSAAKQSLKGAVPVVNEPVSVKEFIEGLRGEDYRSLSDLATTGEGPLKLIAYCFEDERVPRQSIKEVLGGYQGSEIVVLIGPEGDFSHEEAELAIECGFIPVHLGDSRLRTETAALTAVAAAYFRYM